MNVLIIVLVVLSVSTTSFRVNVRCTNPQLALKMALSDYKQELANTASRLASQGIYILNKIHIPNTPDDIALYYFIGKGLLAVDESTKTIGKRLQSIGVENTEENRRDYRNLLFSTPGLGNYISGAILYEETLYQKSKEGKSFVQILNESGMYAGIKVDTGLAPLVGGLPHETL